MTTFSLLSKPMLSPELYEASRSFFVFSQETNALPPRLAETVLKRASDNEAAIRGLALANCDEILVSLRPSAVATNVVGCNLCKPTLQELSDNVVRVFLAAGILLAFGVICYLTYFLLAGNEGLFIKACGIAVVPFALIAVLQVVAGTHGVFIDVVRLLGGKGTVRSEESFFVIANEVSAITRKGLIHSPSKNTFVPTFVSWSEVGATRLENGPNSNVLVFDHHGELLARMYYPATETMTSTDTLDIIRSTIARR
jgi:hypothetical protein